MTPIADRVETLDVMRGIAVFGMFTVNMTADVFWAGSYNDLQPGSADYITLLLVNVFTSGKFITIFSFLFAVGFYVQAERRMADGQSVPSFWLKRVTGLLLIGLVANALTIPAWILVDYSVYGLTFLLFYRLQPKWILTMALALSIIERIFDVIIPLYFPSPVVGQPAVSMVVDAIHDLETYVALNGSFLEIASTNLLHMLEEITWWRYHVLNLDVLVVMLVGLYVAKIGAVWNRDVRVALAKRTAGWLLGLGFVGAVLWVSMTRLGIGSEPESHLAAVRQFINWPFATSVLGLGYAAGVVLLMERDTWRRRLSPFAPIGRMVLSNYLFTGFVLAFISYPWGLGLYGQVFPFAGLVIAVACLPLQVLFSRWWLRHYRFGPFEWLWRCWTYRQLPAMRRAAA